MEIFIKFNILYSRSENQKGPSVIQSQRNVQFIVRLHSNKIHLQNQNILISLPHSSSSGFFHPPAHWTLRNLYYYRSLFKARPGLAQRNTAVNVWDLQVSSLNLKVNLEEETLPNSVTSSESLLKNYFIDSPFTLSSAPTWCFCSSSFHCFYSFYPWWFYAISAVLIAFIPLCLCWFMLTFCVSTFFGVWASFCLVFILFHCLPEFPAFSFSLSKQVVASVLSIKQDPNTHV